MACLSATDGSTFLIGPDESNVFVGGAGPVAMLGGRHPDLFVAGTGNAEIWGGGGGDAFLFARADIAAGQHDVIHGFAPGADHLIFRNVSMREVSLHEDAAGSTELWIGGLGGSDPAHGVLTLEGVHLADFHPADIVFL